MPVREHILDLSDAERKDALLVAASESGKEPSVLEKDVWVVWVLQVLFQSEHAEALTFKGGTSLSKCHNVIERFSEDVDLTYDIRSLLPELKEEKDEVIPSSGEKAKRIIKRIKAALPQRVEEKIVPTLQQALESIRAQGSISLSASPDDVSVILDYQSGLERPEYMKTGVVLEFGARSTGDPRLKMSATCDAAPYLQGVDFPAARPHVMSLGRTFWEKATAIHTFCCKGKSGNRYARHWFDLVYMHEKHPELIRERSVAQQVVEHKKRFYRTGGVQYQDAVSGKLRLVPTDKEMLDQLKLDYETMRDVGYLPTSAEPFRDILGACHAIEEAINGAMGD